jgi:hypothetical protein
MSTGLSTLRAKGWPLVVLVAAVAQAGCYKPNIKDGGLKCNLDAGITKACPEGFKCDLGTTTCWRNPDASVEKGPDLAEVGEEVPPPPCYDARPNCTPSDGGLCDPFCQTGCGCHEKCSVNTVGDLTCNPPRASGFPRGLMQDCMEVLSSGTKQQTDNCAPGSVCIDEGCYPRCFQFCRNDGDCTNSSCTREVGGAGSGQKVCDVPFMDGCVPLFQNTGCGNTMACYISSSTPAHTICDCPFKDVGSNGACTRSRDCIRGLVCVDKGNGQQPVCLQVCRVDLPAIQNGSDCPSQVIGSCLPYRGIPPGTESNSKFGFCN